MRRTSKCLLPMQIHGALGTLQLPSNAVDAVTRIASKDVVQQYLYLLMTCLNRRTLLPVAVIGAYSSYDEALWQETLHCERGYVVRSNHEYGYTLIFALVLHNRQACMQNHMPITWLHMCVRVCVCVLRETKSTYLNGEFTARLRGAAIIPNNYSSVMSGAPVQHAVVERHPAAWMRLLTDYSQYRLYTDCLVKSSESAPRCSKWIENCAVKMLQSSIAL